MIRNYLFVLVAVGAGLLASCATTPKPTPATTPTTPPQAATQPAVPAPSAELSRAKELKAQIAKYNLSNDAPDAYKQGDADLSAGQAAYGSDNATAKTKLDSAIASFEKVLSTGFPIALKSEGAKVDAAQKAALAVKADRAAKSTYDDATSLAAQAQQKQASGVNTVAYDLLDQALAKFQQAEQEAAAARASAQQSINQADTALNQSKTTIEGMQQGLTPNAAPPGGGTGNATSGTTSAASGGGQ